MVTDLRGRIKPQVYRVRPGVWEAVITRGYGGNYEREYGWYFPTWREAHDWAYEKVKDWRP